MIKVDIIIILDIGIDKNFIIYDLLYDTDWKLSSKSLIFIKFVNRIFTKNYKTVSFDTTITNIKEKQ